MDFSSENSRNAMSIAMWVSKTRSRLKHEIYSISYIFKSHWYLEKESLNRVPKCNLTQKLFRNSFQNTYKITKIADSIGGFMCLSVRLLCYQIIRNRYRLDCIVKANPLIRHIKSIKNCFRTHTKSSEIIDFYWVFLSFVNKYFLKIITIIIK